MPAYTRSERREISQQELAPLDAALRGMGFKFESIPSREIMESALYGIAIPTIVRFLKENELSDLAMDNAAALLTGKCPELKAAWSDIVDLYRKAPVGYGPVVQGDTTVLMYNAKNTLANALLRAYSAPHLSDVIELVADQQMGESRLLFLRILKRQRKKDEIALVLDKLKKDPFLGTEIKRWKN